MTDLARPWLTADGADEPDGRRQRALDSRTRIVAAMLELTRQGHVSVSAELVAERANVGLRTVFRHFEDMDSLYREMSLIIEASFAGEVTRPFAAAHWRGQVAELIQRRTAIFERITPFKRSEAAHRHRSRFLDDDIGRMNRWLRDKLVSLLPSEIVADAARLEALDLLLSFESWDRLRREQGLSAAQAREALEAAVARLLA
jgi:AcrR family transcriptional regulator